MIDHCSKLSFIQVLLFGLCLAVGFELITVGMRFGLGLQSTRDTGVLAAFTLGIRVHHGYFGLLLIGIAWAAIGNAGLRNAMLIVGVGLLVSDLVHHFLVLWPITGSPEFHLVYPDRGHLGP
jgi:hypothetical protein